MCVIEQRSAGILYSRANSHEFRERNHLVLVAVLVLVTIKNVWQTQNFQKNELPLEIILLTIYCFAYILLII